MSSTSIIDTNVITTKKLPALYAFGIRTIIRYLNPLNPRGDKNIKPTEAEAIAHDGMRLGLVCEGWGGAENFVHGDINAPTGKRDAEFCREYARTVGAPDGACIYFAIDTDASATQINDLVIPYFRAVRDVMNASGLAIGIYGSGAVCMALVSKGLVDMTWLSQSMGWTGSRAYRDSNRWNLLQGPVTKICGLDTDVNTANGPFGDFIPFAGEAPPLPHIATPADTQVHDAFWLQRKLNQLGADPQLAVDGQIGPKTVEAIEKYLPAGQSA